MTSPSTAAVGDGLATNITPVNNSGSMIYNRLKNRIVGVSQNLCSREKQRK